MVQIFCVFFCATRHHIGGISLRILCGAFVFIYYASTLCVHATPWADKVISYTPQNVSYTNAHAALGHAVTHHHNTNTAVTMIEPAWGRQQIVSIGHGGELILSMGYTVTNYDQSFRLYGVDMIVYGNSFFVYGSGTPYTAPWSMIFEERAEIAVSYDLTNWFRAVGVYADSYMPTQSIDIYGNLSNYRIPINPALLTNDWFDGTWTYTNTVLAYAKSAGGTPVDLSRLETEDHEPISTNIPYARYIRFRDVSNGSTEIDAVVITKIIPEPSMIGMLLLGVYICKRYA